MRCLVLCLCFMSFHFLGDYILDVLFHVIIYCHFVLDCKTYTKLPLLDFYMFYSCSRYMFQPCSKYVLQIFIGSCGRKMEVTLIQIKPFWCTNKTTYSIVTHILRFFKIAQEKKGTKYKGGMIPLYPLCSSKSQQVFVRVCKCEKLWQLSLLEIRLAHFLCLTHLFLKHLSSTPCNSIKTRFICFSLLLSVKGNDMPF